MPPTIRRKIPFEDDENILKLVCGIGYTSLSLRTIELSILRELTLVFVKDRF